MDPEEEAARAEEARLAAIAAAAEGEDPPPPVEDPPQDPPEEPEAPAAGDPPADAPAAEDPPAPAAAAPAPAAPRGTRTFEARIGELSAEKRALKARAAALEAENARLRAARQAAAAGDPPSEPEVDPPAPGSEVPQRTQFRTQEEFDEAVRAEAARQAQINEFNNRCNAVDDAGMSINADRWKAAKRNLGLLDDDGRIPYDLLSVALEADKPEVVLLTLGEDPDRAAALLKMSPTKRAMEIAKMSTAAPPKPPAEEPEAPKPTPRSAAPDPIEPIRGRGAPPPRNEPSDGDSDEEWLRKRNAQIEARRIAEAELARKLG